jgi:integrase
VAKRLTPLTVRKLRASKVRREIPDAAMPGLHLVIQPTGRRVWALRLRRPDGRSAKVTLGPVDITNREVIDGSPVVGQLLTLAAARQLAAALHRERAMGRDVAAEAVTTKRRARGERAAAAAGTFGRAVVDYVASTRKNLRRWQRSARMLGVDEDLRLIPGGLAERWGTRSTSEVTSHDVYFLVDEVRHRGVPGLERRSAGSTDGQARVMHAMLSAAFSWFVQNRRCERNPCTGVQPPEAGRERDRVLSDDELVKLWRATEQIGGNFGSIFRILTLTGCRLNEIAQMRWAELSDDFATLKLPAERVKNKTPHDVPLSPMARGVIAAVPRISGSDFVFTSRSGRPVSAFSKAKAAVDALMGADVPPWRTHDVRRTVATGLQRLGVPLAVTEKVLNHEGESFAGIVRVYQKYEYAAEKRAALERGAAHVEGLVSGASASVTPIRRRRGR